LLCPPSAVGTRYNRIKNEYLQLKKSVRHTFVIAISLCVSLIVFESGCVKQLANQPLVNQPPKTFFWLFPDTGIASGISRQEIHWWGEDPDGYVIGYLLAIEPNLLSIPSPDTITYSFVTVTDSLMAFPLRQASQTFLVALHAVDNTFKFLLPVGAHIRLSPFAYWDQNENGSFDGSDVRLDGLMSSIDVGGAKQAFPTVNTPPTLDYVYDLSDPTTIAQPPKQTFTVASFSWVGHDLDGDETIKSYRISLNDSAFANPLTISSNYTTITLSVPRSRSDPASSTVDADVLVGTSPNLRTLGTLPGLALDATNILYVQAVDVAGGISKFERFPVAGSSWYVVKPRGKILMVSDYQKVDSTTVRGLYGASLSQLGVSYDFLDIRTGSTATRKAGALVPARQHINPALTMTLKLYPCVFWYTDALPSLAAAQLTLFDYRTSMDGGHLIFTTEFQTINDPSGALQDFTPVDSVCTISLLAPLTYPLPGDNQIPKGYQLYPDSSDASDFFPRLEIDTLRFSYAFNMRPIYKNTAARYIYHLQPDTRVPIHYTGSPNLGVMDENKRVIFLGMSLNYLTGTSKGGRGIAAFFAKAFSEFSLQ
jgi:hypothetical protein